MPMWWEQSGKGCSTTEDARFWSNGEGSVDDRDEGEKVGGQVYILSMHHISARRSGMGWYGTSEI